MAYADFGVSGEVRDAIRWHTTGKADMTLLEKIIYLADYIEPTRDFCDLTELRRLAFENLDGALLLGFTMAVEDLAKKGMPVASQQCVGEGLFERKATMSGTRGKHQAAGAGGIPAVILSGGDKNKKKKKEAEEAWREKGRPHSCRNRRRPGVGRGGGMGRLCPGPGRQPERPPRRTEL